jgi:hypothetical protein
MNSPINRIRVFLAYDAFLIRYLVHAYYLFDDYFISIFKLMLESLLECDYAAPICVITHYLVYHYFLELLAILVNDYELLFLFFAYGLAQSSKVSEYLTEEPVLASVDEPNAFLSAEGVHGSYVTQADLQSIKCHDNHLEIIGLNVFGYVD